MSIHNNTDHVVVVDLPLLRVALEGSDNPISLEKPCQASLSICHIDRDYMGTVNLMFVVPFVDNNEVIINEAYTPRI